MFIFRDSDFCQKCQEFSIFVHIKVCFESLCTRCGPVRTEEMGSYVHCVNGLDQNADLYVNRHGVDRLSGAIVIDTGCHARRYLCAQLLQFPSELDLFEICHKGIRSFRHPVLSTPS